MPFLESQKKRRNDSETEGRLRGALLLEPFNAFAGDDAGSVLRADGPPYSSIIALSCASSSPAFIGASSRAKSLDNEQTLPPRSPGCWRSAVNRGRGLRPRGLLPIPTALMVPTGGRLALTQ